MTRDELIEKAAKAWYGAYPPLDESDFALGVLDDTDFRIAAIVEAIEPLIRADEREECAKIVDARKPLYTHLSGINACSECASSIRARGEA